MRLLIAICMLLQIPAFAQEGTQFRELTFEQALAVAKEEGKLLFVDCYTSWCGPCKDMAENVFPQPEAGEYFNPRFVCVKYDMEKGEGPELAERFDVHAYPTFVIVRPDGTVQHKLVGGSGLEEFIARVEKGMNEQTSLLSLNEAYKRGGMDNATLMAYYSALAEAADDDQAAKVYAPEQGDFGKDIQFPYVFVSSVAEYENYEKYFVDDDPYNDDEIAALAELSYDELNEAATSLSIEDVMERHA